MNRWLYEDLNGNQVVDKDGCMHTSAWLYNPPSSGSGIGCLLGYSSHGPGYGYDGHSFMGKCRKIDIEPDRIHYGCGSYDQRFDGWGNGEGKYYPPGDGSAFYHGPIIRKLW